MTSLARKSKTPAERRSMSRGKARMLRLWRNMGRQMAMGTLEPASKSSGIPLVGGFRLTDVIWGGGRDCGISSVR